MNNPLKKTSFWAGIFLIFSVIVFTPLFQVFSLIQDFLKWFDSSKLLVAIMPIIVIILDLVFVIKLIKSLRLRELAGYYVTYFLGFIATLLSLLTTGLLFYNLISSKTPLPYFVLFLVALYSLFSFRYQKEDMISASDVVSERKSIFSFFIVSIVLGVVAYIIVFYFKILPLALMPLISILILLFLPWWRKITANSRLKSFWFLVVYQLIVTGLITTIIFYLGILYRYNNIWYR
jgi:hypothetical protein